MASTTGLMIGKYADKAKWGILLAMVTGAVGRTLIWVLLNEHVWRGEDAPYVLLRVFFGLLGFILYIWGCSNYALAKGYSGWLSIVPFALVVIFCLKDRTRYGARQSYGFPVLPSAGTPSNATITPPSPLPNRSSLPPASGPLRPRPRGYYPPPPATQTRNQKS